MELISSILLEEFGMEVGTVGAIFYFPVSSSGASTGLDLGDPFCRK